MTTILGVAEVVLHVEDMARSRQFYREVLGLPISAEFADACFLQIGPHSRLILFERAALQASNSPIPDHYSEGQTHFALAIDPQEMDAWRERLQAHGVAIEHEQDWPQGTHSLYFRDPDQHSVELMDATHYPHVWEQLQR